MNDKTEIYKYLDKKGIPFVTLVQMGIAIEPIDDIILQKIQLENEQSTDEIIEKGSLIISKHTHWGIVEPRMPNEFKLSEKEQIRLVLDWFTDTTGFIVNEFKTLLELPILNGNPFLLCIVNKQDEKCLILARKTLNGNLTIKKKYNEYGRLQYNFINTFGKISRINGDVYIDNVMENFGELEIISGDLSFSNHTYQNKLESLSPLKKINGDLYLKNTHASLGSIEEIKGNLNLRKTTVKDLGNLKKVGKNVLVSKSEKDRYDFSKIEIGGTLKYFNDIFNKGELTLPKY